MLFTSKSSSRMAADLPPSSRETLLSCSPAMAAMRRPTGVLPVKVTLSTPGWPIRYSATSASAGSTEITPSGTPASVKMSATILALSGVKGAGLSTIVQPASKAGASLFTARNSGTFQAVTAATTPSGSRLTLVVPNEPVRVSCHPKVPARFA